jgi:hypothetical protein
MGSAPLIKDIGLNFIQGFGKCFQISQPGKGILSPRNPVKFEAVDDIPIYFPAPGQADIMDIKPPFFKSARKVIHLHVRASHRSTLIKEKGVGYKDYLHFPVAL